MNANLFVLDGEIIIHENDGAYAPRLVRASMLIGNQNPATLIRAAFGGELDGDLDIPGLWRIRIERIDDEVSGMHEGER